MKSRNINLTEGPMMSRMISYAVPIALASVLQLLYSAADLVVIGQFAGPDAFAAVGATPSLTNLFVTLFIAMATGGCICVAQYYGARDAKNVSETVHTCIALSLVGGVIVALLGFFFAEYALRLMGTPEDIIKLAVLYMKIIFLSYPFTLFYNFASGIIRAAGDTKTPFYILAVSGIVNVVLNLVFVICFNMSVEGVALATAVGAVINAVWSAKVLMNTSDITYLDFKKVKFHKDKLLKIINFAIPSAIQSFMFSFSNVLIQSSVNSFGSVAVIAGSSAASNIEGFHYTIMNAISVAALNFASQNFGARKYDRVKKTVAVGSLLTGTVGLFIGIIIFILKVPLLSIYQPDNPEAIAAGIERLSVFGFTYFLCGIYEVIANTLRAIGMVWLPACVCMVSVCGLRIVWIFTIFKHYHTLSILYSSYPVTWIITIAVLLGVFLVRSKHFFDKNEKQYNSIEA